MRKMKEREEPKAETYLMRKGIPYEEHANDRGTYVFD